VKRLYIPLPDDAARGTLIRNLLRHEHHNLTDEHIASVVRSTRGYSGADLRALCTEAAFGPVRSVSDLRSVSPGAALRPISFQDFVAALKQVRASVSQDDLEQYREWNRLYGSFPMFEPAAEPEASASASADAADAQLQPPPQKRARLVDSSATGGAIV
jgi:ATP-dependent 26S proteasome regulatory subunit